MTTGPGEKGHQLAVGEAVDQWRDRHEEADDEERQYGLFAEPLTEAGQAKLVNYRRGPGRPAGSRNRRTEQTVRFLLSRHRDPRAVLLEIAEANPADLAALLGCTLFEALQEKRLAAIGVLPYVAARITPEVLTDNRQVVHLTINEGRAADQVQSSASAIVLDAVEYQEIAQAAEIPSAENDQSSDSYSRDAGLSHNSSHKEQLRWSTKPATR